MLSVGQKYDTLRVVKDQIGTPTYTYDLARLLVDMAETERYGYYHATNEGGYISWYDFAKEIFGAEEQRLLAGDRDISYFKSVGALFLNFYHPACRKSREYLYNYCADVFQSLLEKGLF